MELMTAAQMIRFAAALALVVAMMVGLGLIMRRINAGSGLVQGQKRRLKIVEMMNLDHRRRREPQWTGDRPVASAPHRRSRIACSRGAVGGFSTGVE